MDYKSQKAYLQAKLQQLQNEIPKYENLYFGHTYYGTWEPKTILAELYKKAPVYNDACYCNIVTGFGSIVKWLLKKSMK